MISIRQLTKHYGPNPVLRGIDLEVAAGEFVVVLGQSGAGKSTLLRCINRLVQADSGTLSVAGIDALACRDTSVLRRQAAMIFQHHNVVPRLSVLKNVLTGCLGAVSTLTSIMQLFRREDVALAMQCLERVELAHKARERTDSLSGGADATRGHRTCPGATPKSDSGRRAGGQSRPEDCAPGAAIFARRHAGAGYHGVVQPAPGRLRPGVWRPDRRPGPRKTGV